MSQGPLWRFSFVSLMQTHLEEEGVGVVSQLAQQLSLCLGVDRLVAVLQRRVNLLRRQVQLPAEGDADHVHVVSAVTEGAGEGDEHWGPQERLMGVLH